MLSNSQLGVAVIWLGYLVSAFGIDRSSDRGVGFWGRAGGFGVWACGLILAFGGAGLCVGLGFFGWWLLPFGGAGL